MKPAPFLILLALVGLFVGYFSGSRMGSHFNTASKTSSAIAARPNEPGRALASVSPAARHDLKSLLLWWHLERGGVSEVVEQLERMDTAAIRSLMVELAGVRGISGQRDSGALSCSLEAAGREIFRRDGEPALGWAAALDPAQGRQKILAAMIAAAAAESPQLAKSWIDRYLLEFGRIDSGILFAASRGATARGAEGLVELKKLYGNMLIGSLPNGPLPENFNHRLFMENFGPGEPESRTTLQQWAAKDPEAAWLAVKDYSARHPRGSSYFGALFVGMAVGGKEREAIRWLMPKLDELPQESRSSALGGLFSDSWNTRAAVADIMAEMPREDDRLAVAESLLDPYNSGPATLAALQALGSEKAQVRALVKSAESWRNMIKSPPDEMTRKSLRHYSTIAEELQLSPESRAEIDARLRPDR